jgi:hypothetical protein
VKIFISWSGKRSRRVAKALRTFLQDVNQRIEPWMSETDIPIGSRWALDLAKELEETHFGIVCITQEALQSPWLLFEAGALSKSVRNARVCPYLIGLEKKEISGPIAQFQCVEAMEESTYELLKSINQTMENEGLTEERLKKYFLMFWPDLKAIIEEVSKTAFLSPMLHTQLIDMFVSCFSIEELEIIFFDLGLPRSRVNWKQALYYACHEVIQVAFDAGKLIDLLESAVEKRERRVDLYELVVKVRETLSVGTTDRD